MRPRPAIPTSNRRALFLQRWSNVWRMPGLSVTSSHLLPFSTVSQSDLQSSPWHPSEITPPIYSLIHSLVFSHGPHHRQVLANTFPAPSRNLYRQPTPCLPHELYISPLISLLQGSRYRHDHQPGQQEDEQLGRQPQRLAPCS